MNLTDRFLKAKHWQLFILLFGIPLIFQFAIMGSVFSKFALTANPDPIILFDFMKYFPVMMIIYMAIFFGWFWSIAIGLQKKIPENVTMKVTKFKVFFFIPMVYILIFIILHSFFINGLFSSNSLPDARYMGIFFLLIFPIHMFAIYCIFYCLYFVAKTFKTVELQRVVNFNEFAGEFFMFWFYPIGIWLVQPKINKMARANTH